MIGWSAIDISGFDGRRSREIFRAGCGARAAAPRAFITAKGSEDRVPSGFHGWVLPAAFPVLTFHFQLQSPSPFPRLARFPSPPLPRPSLLPFTFLLLPFTFLPPSSLILHNS